MSTKHQFLYFNENAWLSAQRPTWCYEHSELTTAPKERSPALPFYVVFTLRHTHKRKKKTWYSKDCHKLGKIFVANKKKIAALNYTPENPPSPPVITESLPFSLWSLSLYESDSTLRIKTLQYFDEGIIHYSALMKG